MDELKIWEEIPVTLSFRDMRGTIPKNPALLEEFLQKKAEELGKEVDDLTDAEKREAGIEGYLAMKEPGVKKQDENEKVADMMQDAEGHVTAVREIAQMAKELAPDWPDNDSPDRMAVGFLRDTKGMYVRGGQVRAHFKDCAACISKLVEKSVAVQGKPLKQFKAKVVDRLYVKEDKVHITRGGATLQEPDEFQDHPLSVMTPRGPRTSIKRVDQVNEVEIKFTLMVLNDGLLKDYLIKAMLDYGQVHGAFQDRSLQYGRYTYKIGKRS
jgi:hypothetical protein